MVLSTQSWILVRYHIFDVIFVQKVWPSTNLAIVKSALYPTYDYLSLYVGSVIPQSLSISHLLPSTLSLPVSLDKKEIITIYQCSAV